MKDILKNSIIILHILFNLFYILTFNTVHAQDLPCNIDVEYQIPLNGNFKLSENSVAVDPNRPNIILNANNFTHETNQSYNRISAFVSQDWGQNWASYNYDNGIFDEQSFCDPAAAINRNGDMYVSYLSIFNTIKVAKSTNRGATWLNSTIPNSSGADKDHLWIDNSCNSPYKDRIYCAWRNASYGLDVAYSSDNGGSWLRQIIPNSTGTIGPNIATDKNGIVYIISSVLTSSGSWNKIRVIKSTNGGVNWVQPTQNEITLNSNANIGNSGMTPSMTINMDNNLFIIYSRYIDVNYLYDVLLIKSSDGGNSWSSETIVNQNRNGNQTYPWISCDPVSAYLACIYYDTRNGGNKYTYISVSTDEGMNWEDIKISTSAWNGSGTGNGNDYIGIDFNKGIIYPIWTDVRIQNEGYRTYTRPIDVICRDLQLTSYNGYNNINSAKSITTNNNIIINTFASVLFQTTESITLNPGFETSEGSNFTAELFTNCGIPIENKNLKPENLKVLTSMVKDLSENLPDKFSLSQNYPNPFNPITTINYTISKKTYVKLIMFNILGQEIKTLINEYQDPGYKSVVLDATNKYGNEVASGIYFYKIIAGDFTAVKKMLLLK